VVTVYLFCESLGTQSSACREVFEPQRSWLNVIAIQDCCLFLERRSCDFVVCFPKTIYVFCNEAGVSGLAMLLSEFFQSVFTRGDKLLPSRVVVERIWVNVILKVSRVAISCFN